MKSSFPSPDTITRTELCNGLLVLVSENHDSQAVVIRGYLWAGSAGETPEQAGLANLTAGMLMRGTEHRSFSEINRQLESVGAQLGFSTGVHTVGFSGKALAEDLDLLLGVLSDVLQRPAFPVEELEKLRGQIITGLQRRGHDTRRMARLTFDALLYPGHPYGRSVLGYEDTVVGLSRGDVQNHWSCYAPEGAVIAVVGAVRASEAVHEVEQALSEWRPHRPDEAPFLAGRRVPDPAPLSERQRQTIVIDGKTQSDLILGWPGLARTAPDYMSANLANTILGVFGMMGRLGKNVRDAQGLAYYAYSQLQAGIGAGPWAALAGVAPEDVDRAVQSILDEIRRLRDEPLPPQDLLDSQSFLTGSMPLRLETNEGVAANLLGMERHQLGLDYLERYAGLVNAVTAQDVQEVVQKYLDPEIYALAVAGP